MIASRISEAKRQGCYVLSDNGTQSYDTRTVVSTADLAPGTPLAETVNGAATVTRVNVAGAGKGVLTLAGTPSDANAPEGVYSIVCIEPSANGGTFQVERPDGSLDGVATVGVPYDGSVNFTLADGATDFVAGDVATVTVSYADGAATLVPAGAGVLDGSQKVVGILDAPIWEISVGTSERIAVMARNGEVINHEMTWPGGGSAAAIKAEIVRQLADKLIVVRG